MVDNAGGGFFISDAEDDLFDDDDIIIPAVLVAPTEAPNQPVPLATAAPIPVTPVTPVAPENTPIQAAPVASRTDSRETRLATALDELMDGSPDVEASALVSLDGFTMASALPQGMHEDRVGAMSAAILGLGERAAAELGRGQLSQVFIEGDDGYIVLMAAGDRAVLTCIASADAKLGLVLYDMRTASDRMAEILG